MRNQLGPGNAESVLQKAYIETATANPALPGEPGIVPPLLPRVMPVHEVVAVDYFLPGCPPSADLIWDALVALVSGKELALEYRTFKFD